MLDATAVAAVGAEDLPVSPDRHAVLVPLQLRADTDEIEPLVELVGAADGQGGFDVELVGEATADRDFEELSGQDLREGELLFGLPAALVVLLLVFGSLLAGLVPLLLAVVSIVVALALAALVGQGFALSLFVVNMITGMGLALGIDYALFILSRFREERAGGRPTVDAIGTAGATASRAVLFSGLAFALAMVGMVLVPDTILRSLAVGAILVGVVSVVAALTLLPALLGLLGDRVNALRLRSWGAAWAVPAVSRGACGRGWSRGGGRPAGPGPGGVGRAAAGAGGAGPGLGAWLCRGQHAARPVPVQAGPGGPGGVVPGRHHRTGQGRDRRPGHHPPGQGRDRAAAPRPGRPQHLRADHAGGQPGGGAGGAGRCRWAPTPKAPPPTPRSASSATSSFPRRSRGWRPRCWSPATPPRTSTTSPSSDAGSRWCWSSCSA